MEVEVCIPWFLAQFALVNQGVLHGKRNVSVKNIVVVGISVVVIDEFPLFVLVSLSHHWSHVDNLVNIQSAHKQIIEIVNGGGWWRSVDPSCEMESLLGIMSIDSHSSCVAFTISPCLPMIAYDFQDAIWGSSNGFRNVIKK